MQNIFVGVLVPLLWHALWHFAWSLKIFEMGIDK